MPTDEHTDRLTERAVFKAALDERLLGVEALRVADRELEVVLLSQRDEIVGLLECECHRLLEQHMFAREQRLARHGMVGCLRCGRDDDDVHFRLHQQLAVVGRCTCSIREARDLDESLGLYLCQMHGMYERAACSRHGADLAAPSGADHAYTDLSHLRIPFGWINAQRAAPR